MSEVNWHYCSIEDFISLTWRVCDIKATGRPCWFKVAETATSDASHSTTKGASSFIECRATYSMHNLFLWRLASSLTISNCACQRDELGLITPSLNILLTLSWWINNRSSWLKRQGLVAMGFTSAVRLENKLTSWVSATTTAQVSSCKMTCCEDYHWIQR